MSRLEGRRPPPRGERGIALAMLLWFVAAMSLVLGSIAMQARVDIKLAQLHAARARAEAAGDGAIQLALAQMLALQARGEFDGRVVLDGTYAIGGLDVAVRAQPLSGLIDVNLAPEDLLALLLRTTAGVPESDARALAASMVEWRTAAVDPEEAGGDGGETGAGNDAIRHGRFEAIEDLLLVPGIDRRIFESVRDAVYVSQRGQSGVDWLSAPVPVLRALGELDVAAARDIAAARPTASAEGALPPEAIDLGFQEAQNLAAYRMDATVSQGADNFLRRRWVQRGQAGRDGLPWHFFRSEPVVAVGDRGERARESGE